MAKKIALFASGQGTNAKIIYSYFERSPDIMVGAICSNSLSGGALKFAKRTNVPSFFLESRLPSSFEALSLFLKKESIDYLVLAGFLLKIPRFIIADYENKIINIHPSLLPKYGGKGMYGKKVHSAVIDHNEAYSGITIHYVNENYDEGAVIFQHPYKIKNGETPSYLERAIQKIEHQCFSLVLEKIINSRLS